MKKNILVFILGLALGTIVLPLGAQLAEFVYQAKIVQTFTAKGLDRDWKAGDEVRININGNKFEGKIPPGSVARLDCTFRMFKK